MLVLFVGVGPASAFANRERFEPAASRNATPDAPSPSPTADSLSKSTPTRAGIATDVISAPPVEEEGVPQENVRKKPEARPVVYEPTATATPKPRPLIPRLDHGVLRWLPEIMAASTEAGVPAELIAGVMQLESGGNPNVISPAGARGMMQIMPWGLINMGIPEYLWHDPATNIRAGAFGLAQRAAAQGSWEGAVAAYFGFGCDLYGTCTEVYISVTFGWAAYFAPAIADPYNSGFAVLPDDWVPPPIAPYMVPAPPKVESPPPAQPTPVASGTPGGSPVATPGTGPTTVPTGPPNDPPTPVPTEVPAEIPTAPPTEIPVDPPADPPTEATAAEG